jgi:hypothetical protein
VQSPSPESEHYGNEIFPTSTKKKLSNYQARMGSLSQSRFIGGSLRYDESRRAGNLNGSKWQR